MVIINFSVEPHRATLEMENQRLRQELAKKSQPSKATPVAQQNLLDQLNAQLFHAELHK